MGIDQCIFMLNVKYNNSPPPNKRLLQSRQPSTSRATLAVTTLAAQQNRRDVRAHPKEVAWKPSPRS